MPVPMQPKAMPTTTGAEANLAGEREMDIAMPVAPQATGGKNAPATGKLAASATGEATLTVPMAGLGGGTRAGISHLRVATEVSLLQMVTAVSPGEALSGEDAPVQDLTIGMMAMMVTAATPGDDRSMEEPPAQALIAVGHMSMPTWYEFMVPSVVLPPASIQFSGAQGLHQPIEADCVDL